MSIVRDVERRRADRLRFLQELHRLSTDERPTPFDPKIIAYPLEISPADAIDACDHLARLGYARYEQLAGGEDVVEITYRGLGLMDEARERPTHPRFGYSALLDYGLNTEPLSSWAPDDREDAIRQIHTLHWIYILSGGSPRRSARLADISVLIGLEGEDLTVFLLALEMDGMVSHDAAEGTLSLTIFGTVLIESVLWRGTRSVAGYPPAVELELLAREEIPVARR